MRTRRILSNDTAIYHCMSRTVNGEAVFGNREKEILRKIIRQVAEFAGVEVLTYCLMKNHFHVLIRVSPIETLPDAELLRRFRVLYPKPTKYQALTIKDVERALAAGGERAEQVRAQLLARMGDVSEFMKTVKQRFSIWFNLSRERFGPVWSDRFKSVLIEGKGFALQTVAAYIDLNPVRAGLVADPKDYRFCGYAEAVAGISVAVEGIRCLTPDFDRPSPAAALQGYRQLLYGKGSGSAVGKGIISREDAIRVLEKEDGVLPLFVLLRCRLRYFTDGAVLGSNEFVQSHMEAWQRQRGRKHSPNVHRVSGGDDGIACINHGRGPAFS